jgi:hypothetical protein
MPGDLPQHARMLNKFRNLCGTRFFYFFPKLLISISRKKIPWRLRAMDKNPIFYRLPRPDVSGISVCTPCPRPRKSRIL